YLYKNQEQIFKVLLAFIEEVTANRGLKITAREKEIFQLLSSGYSAKMIANKLNICETTVITHRKNLIHKLHVNNSAELIKKGFHLNLIS
ncbi:response regulator transcription factor, partial [Mariniphaga sp.]|uniref:response regulator transcription factor n=1 Tax=Mariniphaga sp. TaxID=1954475 RepID=UPI003568A9FA